MITELLELKQLTSNIMEGVGSSGRTVRELFEILEKELTEKEEENGKGRTANNKGSTRSY